MLRSKCATLVLRGGGGERQLGSFGASFSRVRAICSRGRLWLISENLAKNRSFCGTERFLAS